MDSVIGHLIGRPYATCVRSPLNSTFRTFIRFTYCDFQQLWLTELARLRPASVTHTITLMPFGAINVVHENCRRFQTFVVLTIQDRYANSSIAS